MSKLSNNIFNRYDLFMSESWSSRGYSPHFEGKDVYQFITIRLSDSVPMSLMSKWKNELEFYDDEVYNEKKEKLINLIEKYSDNGIGNCYLERDEIAQIIIDCLVFNNGKLYDLIAWSIMPNHVHFLIKSYDNNLSQVIREIKSYTAHCANKALNKTGIFWHANYFDRFIRNNDHFIYTLNYILNNPVKANLSTKFTGSIKMIDEDPSFFY